MQSFYQKNKARINSFGQRTEYKRIAKAHKQAPLDYISPWDNQNNQGQFLNRNYTENEHQKSKNVDSKHTLVNSFLSKIKKNHAKGTTLKGRIKDHEQRSHGSQSKSKETLHKGIRTQEVSMRTVQDIKDSNFGDQAVEKKQGFDVGFGLLSYSRNISYTEKPIENKANQQTQTIKKSFTYYQSTRNKSKTQISKQSNKKMLSDLSELICLPYAQKDRKQMNISKKMDPSQLSISYTNEASHRKELFTEDEKRNPNKVVFVKKKKGNKNVRVVDINSTAQQFYQQQIRIAEQKMMRKYHHYSNRLQQQGSYNRQRRCQTEQKSIEKQKVFLGLGRYSRNEEKVKKIAKKFSFLDELKDQSIVLKIQNLIRHHPPLANSLLLSK